MILYFSYNLLTIISCFSYCSLLQGLPSAYLAPTSFLTDTTDQSSLESSTFASLAHSPTPLPLTTLTTNSRTTARHDIIATVPSSDSSPVSTTGSLPSSLTELAGALGGDEAQPFSSASGGFTPSAATAGWNEVRESGEGESGRKSSGVYNPFDSDGE